MPKPTGRNFETVTTIEISLTEVVSVVHVVLMHTTLTMAFDFYILPAAT